MEHLGKIKCDKEPLSLRQRGHLEAVSSGNQEYMEWALGSCL